ncbi:MAG: hypothetical protein LUD15_05080 [Bacteroides sp.]|nr:hypothetical protein [Bacteroides sp.]
MAITRYSNVKAAEIKKILHHHFKPAWYVNRLKNNLLNQIDMFHTDVTWDNVIWKPEEERTGVIDSFLAGQKHISTEGYGFLTPLHMEEYRANGGFEGLSKVLHTQLPAQVIDTILRSGIRGRGGGGFPTGKKW